MGAELGRISGPLLASNLLRDGVDLSFETTLLYLNVNSGKVGINTDSPTRTLTINSGAKTTNLIVDTQADIANFTISTNTIRDLLGTIYVQPNQTTEPIVSTPKFQAGFLQVSNQLIENITADSDINLSPTGKTIFTTSKVNVNGNLNATGNITFTGNVTFGNDNADNVVFSSDINSNIIPDLDNTYDLGSLGQEWANLYTTTINTTNINTISLSIDNINLLQTAGKTLYVSVNGDDSYYGTHQHSTFRTVKYALSQATSGDTVVVFPGTYTEEFPLTVPQGVSIKGAGIRAVAIQPTAGTNDKNAFLLNGDTTIEFLTVQNFFYNSTNNTGYAFAFAPNFKTISRSPYIYNVTVITRGSVVTSEDPLGFIQGDAGGGVYLDGSLADPTGTIPPSGLFFSVTMIVPNQNGITGTNGVRIEWLNSFTYFAKRGIYLTQGTLGRASQSTVFGAEMRSINSANVYGTFGAVADGADTLAYLIGHNFGYIGTDNDSSNDPQLVIQANEILELNSGHIYYDSQDHQGDFRIGNIFWVEQSTGNVTFNAQSINFGAGGSITLEGPSSTTIIDKDKIQTSNIRIHDNNIDSLVGPVQFLSASGSTYLNTDVTVTGKLDITGDALVRGNVYLGNDPFDTVAVYPNLTQNINPKTTNTYTLGTDNGITPKRWRTAFLAGVDIDGVIDIRNNTLSTLTLDTDLRLLSSGTGAVQVATTDVQINNKLTVANNLTANGTTSLKNIEIGTLAVPKTLTIVGNFNQTGDVYLTGLFANNNIQITGNSYLTVPNLKIFNNEISATATNSDLNFVGFSTGGVVLDSRLKFKDNVISNVWSLATTDTQKSVFLKPDGSGLTRIDSTKALAVAYGNNSNRVLGAVGEIRQNSTTKLYEGHAPSGLVSFNNIYDSDRNTYITPELTPGYNDNILRFGINGVEKATINSTTLYSNTLLVDNVRFSGNNISNNVTSNDLELLPTGVGLVNINNLLFKDNTITNNTNVALTLESTGGGYVKFTGTGAVVFPHGTDSQRRLTPEMGELRYNTEPNKKYMEVYDAGPAMEWIPLGGASSTATVDQIEEETNLWAFILG